MTTLKKFGTAFFSFALFGITVVTPTNAAVEVKVHGNGSRSDNEVSFNLNKKMTLTQSNTTAISNNVDISNNTGGNRASGATGGDVRINSGDADATVEITNFAGVNIAEIGCNCVDENYSFHVADNGHRSDTTVSADVNNSVAVSQKNYSDIDNDVSIENNTGNNSAAGSSEHKYPWYEKDQNGHTKYEHSKKMYADWMKKYYPWYSWSEKDYQKWFEKYHNHSGNTGGDVSLETGDATSHVSLSNTAGYNFLSQ